MIEKGKVTIKYTCFNKNSNNVDNWQKKYPNQCTLLAAHSRQPERHFYVYE